MQNSQITLAIETAIGGGSIALFRGVELVASQLGKTDISRAETLLIEIEDVLSRAGVKKTEIDQIAVSLGPGSFTGIRIGIATVLGLKTALRIPCFGVSALQAVAREKTFPCIVALPVGKNDVAWQEFRDERGMPAADSEDLFLEFIRRRQDVELYVHSLLVERLRDVLADQKVHAVGTDLAVQIGRAVIAGRGSEDLLPTYLRTSRYTGIA